MKKCVVSVKGFQNLNEDSDFIEMKADGKFWFDNDKTVIVYHENQSFNKDVRVLIKVINDDKVVVERSGAINSQMIFQKGKRNCNYYSSPQGKMLMGIYTEGLYREFNENGGFVSADYQIDIEDKIISRNRIEITVKEV